MNERIKSSPVSGKRTRTGGVVYSEIDFEQMAHESLVGRILMAVALAVVVGVVILTIAAVWVVVS